MTTKQILPLPESTYQLLLDAAGAWPDGVATQWIPDLGDYTRCLAWTYAELAGTVTRIANALTSLGVRRADAVTLASVNTSMLYAATLAAQAAGIAAPVNPALSAERIAELIRRTGSRVMVAAGPELDPQLWQRLLGVARQAGMTAVLALRPDGAHSDPPPLTGDDAANGRGPLTVAYLDEVIAGQPSGHLTGADLPKADDLAAFVHTGGTTGAPKIAAHTHANQLACGRGIAACSGLAAGEGTLGGLPLFHVNALIVTGIAPMFNGARVVWPGPAGYRDKALYTRFWTIVEHYRIAAMSAVPTVYGTLAQVPVDADISTLRVPIVGASPLPSSVREAFARHTGLHLLEGYGLTEATCASTWTRPGEERPGSVGRTLPGQQIKAVRIGDDGSWTACAPGETGVLMIGGPAVFAGVRHRPGRRRPPGQPGRHRPGRLAEHRRPRQRRRRRLRLPHRPGQGPHHPRRPQHRPPGHRGRAAGPSRRRRRRGRRPPGPTLRRGPSGLHRPGRPRPVRRGRPAGLGRRLPSTSPPPGPSTSTRSTPSRSPRWASSSSPR